MTYRDRREARADRLRGWADKRDVKATTAYETASRMAEAIPFGQPILVGHYSEGRDRRYRDRIGSNMNKAVESSRMATSMRSRADNIEAAAANAIYSDDPDAVEALTAKIARLEAERARIKAYNASCRKAAKVDPQSIHGDLDLLDADQRAWWLRTFHVAAWQMKNGSYPSYHMSNLGGVISTAKKRLAELRKAV